MTITYHQFPKDPAKTSYCVFPEDLENNDLVVFHATPKVNLDANGFKIPGPESQSGLLSVSFAKKSRDALSHAMTKKKDSDPWCIIAAKYQSLEREKLVVNLTDLHDYSLAPAPEIIGVCEIPVDYRHV